MSDMCTPTEQVLPDNSATETRNGSGNGIRRRVAVLDSGGEEEIGKIVMGLEKLTQHVHPPVPNPAPLGLIAFGFTTCLLQMKHSRLTGSDPDEMAGVTTILLGFAMFFGGLLQIIAGVSEIRRNNIFGYTAFNVYGGFWMSVGTVSIVTILATNAPPVNLLANQAMLFLLGVTSFMFWVLTFQLNKTICVLFFLLVCTCFLLSFGTQNATVDTVGGYFGILTSAVAFWLAFVELVNDVMGHGTEILPLFHWHWNQSPHSGGLHVPGRIRGHSISQLVSNGSSGPSRRKVNADEADVECAV